MCDPKVLKNNSHGYVIQCKSCKYIQIAFGTCILSLTMDQFDELIDTVSSLYRHHSAHPFPDQKVIQVPTAYRAVTLVFSVNELKNFVDLLVAGRDKLQYKKLFIFNEN